MFHTNRTYPKVEIKINRFFSDGSDSQSLQKPYSDGLKYAGKEETKIRKEVKQGCNLFQIILKQLYIGEEMIKLKKKQSQLKE